MSYPYAREMSEFHVETDSQGESEADADIAPEQSKRLLLSIRARIARTCKR